MNNLLALFTSLLPSSLVSSSSSSSSPVLRRMLLTASAVALAGGFSAAIYHYRHRRKLFCEIKTSLKHRTILITGASDGVGKVAARELAALGATVILAVRNMEKGEKVKNEIIAFVKKQEELKQKQTQKSSSTTSTTSATSTTVSESSSLSSSYDNSNRRSSISDIDATFDDDLLNRVLPIEQRLLVMHLDLSSFDSVRQFAINLETLELPIDTLINNAGTLENKYHTTTDGYEATFQVNYLSPFLLTHLLIELLQRTADKRGKYSRIINVASRVEENGTIDFEDINNQHKKKNTNTNNKSKNKMSGITSRYAKEKDDRQRNVREHER